jgi:hypothetical protein
MRKWLIAGGIVLGLFAGLVTVAALLPEAPERLPGSITNARPEGVRALGQVLAADGVDVAQVTGLDEATAAAPGTTLAVYLDRNLSTDALARLRDVPADLVVVYGASDDVDDLYTLTGGRISGSSWWTTGSGPADCTDPDAIAAGTISVGGTALMAEDESVTTCFGDDEESALYADVRAPGHRITVIAGTRWVRNDTITQEGNAALALRVFGRNARLTWYLPGVDAVTGDQREGTGPDLFALLPPWSRAVMAVLLAAAAAAALWRGRRFGALVREQMPVEVPASEVSSGLARLYRQSAARGHAAAGLRAATVHRLAARLGLPSSAPPELVVERLATASGQPPSAVRELCYGPPPATDAALVELATSLTDLERKLTTRE